LEQPIKGEGGKQSLLFSGTSLLGLLGIHVAQFPEEWELKRGKTETDTGVPLVGEGLAVKGLSGMTVVLPAWHILEVLNMPHLRRQRAITEARMGEELAAEGKTVPDAEEARDAEKNHTIGKYPLTPLR
jgi:hypothetical protein